MSLNVPSRRLLKSASSTLSSPSANSLLLALQCLSLLPSSRHSFSSTPSQSWWGGKKNEDTGMKKEVTGSASSRKRLLDRLSATKLEGSSIFEDELKSAPTTTPTPSASTTPSAAQAKSRTTISGASLVKEHLARAVDPDPQSRARWQRKMVIRRITRGTDAFSKEPRSERIARTERQLLSKSPWLATSVKKLVHLARQVQGKTVEDALVQMKYSKKKMAKEVKVQLEEARDLAVTERGMGLGIGAKKEAAAGGKDSSEEVEIKIKTKDGKHLTIDDPTRMYVAEAWVNRGPWRGFGWDYRARGRVHKLHKPSTSISLVIKEEKTRIREHQEREVKKYKQGPWVHLPNRPVTAQRQFYSW
ncbi:ribosomal protein L22/L17 [Diplogelasinospora grovesii]|uniref:Ribosomal protein L22/L17 n=1 Tax=Diplogelasinospora grovesii TaxID=303347 RepID=A0AAN6S7H9_9PEZI|nr:ribosomal protein L22/L17 [Diplogelasinospora grovesii]